jgi:hypothetical protein
MAVSFYHIHLSHVIRAHGFELPSTVLALIQLANTDALFSSGVKKFGSEEETNTYGKGL